MNRWLPLLWIIAISSLVGLVALVTLGAYLAIFEPPFLSYANQPFKMLNPVVRPGENLRYVVIRCSNLKSEKAYFSTRTLVPVDAANRRVVLDGTSTSVLPGCSSSVSSLIVVPKDIAPGEYYAAGIATISSTVGTDRQVNWRTESFLVLP